MIGKARFRCYSSVLISLFVLFLLVIIITEATGTTNNSRRSLLGDDNDNNDNNGINNNDNVSMHPNDISRSAVAMKLSTIVEGPQKDADKLAASYGFDPKDGVYLESENKIDAVYIAKVQKEVKVDESSSSSSYYCTVAFRGTSFQQVSDWFVNLDLDPVSMPSYLFGRDNVDDDMECEVHGGYHEAYVSFEYRFQVETFVRNCQHQCNENNEECETLLIGHSQGGGIAEIAALFHLQQPQPDLLPSPLYVITFGGVPSLGAGCQSMLSIEERRRWFRYILTNEGRQLARGTRRKKLVYDPVPMMFAQLLDPPVSSTEDNMLDRIFGEGVSFFNKLPDPTIADSYARKGLAFIGHELLLSFEDPSVLYLSGFDRHRFVDLSYIDISFGKNAHHVDPYYQTLIAQDEYYNHNRNNNNDAVITSDGFADGSLCNPDEVSTTCSKEMVCVKEDTEGSSSSSLSWWSSFWESERYICQPGTEQQPQQQQVEQQQRDESRSNTLTSSSVIAAASSSNTVLLSSSSSSISGRTISLGGGGAWWRMMMMTTVVGIITTVVTLL